MSLILRSTPGGASCRTHKSARHLPVAQELEELDPLAQPAPHHLWAHDHLGDQRGDLLSAEIEALVKGFERFEDFGVRQMRVVERRDLPPAVVEELGMGDVEPTLADRLAI